MSYLGSFFTTLLPIVLVLCFWLLLSSTVLLLLVFVIELYFRTIATIDYRDIDIQPGLHRNGRGLSAQPALWLSHLSEKYERYEHFTS